MKAPDPVNAASDLAELAAPPAQRAAAIGSRLRQIFDEAAAEPLPQAFEDLLRKLG